MPQVTYSGPQILRANQRFFAKIKVEFTEEVLPGGRIAIANRHFSDFGDGQVEDENCENFVSLECSRADVSLVLEFGNNWVRHPWNRGLELVVQRNRLVPGDWVSVFYGGKRGYRCQSFSESRSVFLVGLKPSEGADWVVMEKEQCPVVRILGGDPVGVRVHVRRPNDECGLGTVTVKLEDTYGNVASCGPIELDLLVDDTTYVQTVVLSGAVEELLGVPLPADGRWHRLTAASADGRFFGRSNPFGPALVEGYQLYWGEMHSQSGLCDGTNSPREIFDYGRRAAGLDFASVTSHDMELTPDDWEEIKQATREAHVPGEYVTFLGYEWSGRTPEGGDNNVYFLEDDGPLLYCGPFMVDGPEGWLPSYGFVDRTRSIRDVIGELADRPVLIIPHCGGRIANFDFHDSSKMPVMEVHSAHRCYEDVALEVIRRGIRVGFVGGSDDHRGALGDSVPTARDRFFSSRSGLMGVYAKELTRESIWEAIFARRVYATAGCKMALAFWADEAIMGEELVKSEGAPVHLRFSVVTDGLFSHAELVRQDEVIARFSRNQNQIPRIEGDYEDIPPRGVTPYFVRIYQTDGGRGWSSPIWVCVD